MPGATEPLQAFLDAHPSCALVEVVEARGSTPREQGAWMLVAGDAILGTIGGGQLEWMAIDEARRMVLHASEVPSGESRRSSEERQPLERGCPTPSRLRQSTSPPSGERGRVPEFSSLGFPLPLEGVEATSSSRHEGVDRRRAGADRAAVRSGGTISKTVPRRQSSMPSVTQVAERYSPSPEACHSQAFGSTLLDIPLGPEIGQCCGGRVKLGIRLVDGDLRDDLVSEARARDAARPSVFLFGAGHVGHALAAALALLPVQATVVETRGDALDGVTAGVQSRLTPVPEEAVRAAPPASAFVILTHDHALDFLLAAEALKRGDAAYVGMIGSKTKRATFRRWFVSEAGGTEAQFTRLVSPIGGRAVRDKRPAVIAALAVAEIVSVLFAATEADASNKADAPVLPR